jgi:two-component system sensor histidine kinase QseC
MAWALGALAVLWLGFVVAGYRTGLVETDALTDGHLASVAALLVDAGGLGLPAPPMLAGATPAASDSPVRSHEYQVPVSVVVWDADGRVLQRIGAAPLPDFDAAEGFASLALGQPAQRWRSFARWTGGEPRRRVMVLISESQRRSLAWNIAGQVAQPGLWLLPAVALALGLAIRRGLRPLRALSDDVLALDVQQAQCLHDDHPEREFNDMVAAINALVQRYHAALQRERALAGELAHELRTPLSALVLQARALRESSAPADAQALARLEHDALHAGQVLTQLLALARASHTALAEAAQPVDLDALARRVLADRAPAALEAGHELALASDGPFLVDGHAVLLELALRNLVDNAVAHTPAGTLVELRLTPQARRLQVCDGPLAHPTAPADAPPQPARVLGLGLGHQVVAKVAAIHGARFKAVPPPPGFDHCYQLQFGTPAGAGRSARRVTT